MDGASTLQMDSHIATIAHLQMLVADKTIAKDSHDLKESDVDNLDKSRDRMNTDAVARICSLKVQEALKKIPGSLVTHHQFLKLMYNLLHACFHQQVSIEDRLECLEYLISFIRQWRQHIAINKLPTSCFITSNVWSCLELILVFYVRLLIKGKVDLITICGSQCCEELFQHVFFRNHSNTLVTFSLL
jgi:hypothetical protein